MGNGIVDAYVPGQPAETRDLKLGNGNSTENVTVSRSGKVTSVMGRLDVEEHARIGTAGNDGKVDAAADTRDLKVGTDANATNNVQISQSGKETDVKGRLDAEEHIRVGTGGDGNVDASANNLDLKLGTDTTRDVIICHAGQVLILQGDTVWINAAKTIGFKPFPAGRGAGECFDIITSGAVHFYVDTAGGHNL